LGTWALLSAFGLFEGRRDDRWLVGWTLLSFGYIGLCWPCEATRFSLIIPCVRFAPQNKPDNLLLLDTSVVIDGRIAD
jgi:hypothetical protein